MGMGWAPRLGSPVWLILEEGLGDYLPVQASLDI